MSSGVPRYTWESWTLAFLLLVFVVAAYSLRFTVDDAYIAMRYARHFAEGKGLVYNIGERVEGYTSLLWVLMLAAAHKLGFRMIAAAQVLGIVLSGLALILVYRVVSRRLPGDAAAARLVPIAFLATSWIYAGWATGGLETALFAFVTVLCVAHLESLSRGGSAASIWMPILCLLLVMTRPEGLMMAGLIGLASLWIEIKAGRRPTVMLAQWAIAFAVPIILLEAARLRYYGEWLPNTFYVKVNKVEYVDRGWPFFVSFARDSMFYVWGPAALVAALSLRDLVSTLIVLYSGLYIGYTIWVGGDWMGYRFYQHLMPLLSIPIAHLISRGVDEIKRPGPAGVARLWQAPLRSGIPVLATLAMFVVVEETAFKTRAEGRETRLTMGELDNYQEMDTPEPWALEAGYGLDAVLKPGEAAAASFAGFTAVYTDRTVIDTHGLTDKYVGHLPAAIRGGPGHEKFAPHDYLLSRYVVLVNPWPGHSAAESNRTFAVEYAPGAFLYFDALLPTARIIDLIHGRGFSLWVRKQEVFDTATAESSPVGLDLDFESGTWDGWTISGNAFSAVPATVSGSSGAPNVVGAQGRHYADTRSGNGAAAQGTAQSRDFTIAGDVIHFLIAGGESDSTALELWVDGRRVRSTSGRNSDELVRVAWDVADLQGKTAHLIVRDDSSADWGFVAVDDIHMAKLRPRGPQ